MILVLIGLSGIAIVASCASGRFRSFLRRHLVVAGVVALLVIGAIVLVLTRTDLFAIDACMDRGGAWDPERKICDLGDERSGLSSPQ